MIIDSSLLDDLQAEAAKSPRLRMARDMRNSAADSSQRMLNALEPGTIIPIHRHPSTSESCLILRGAAEEVFFDNDGRETMRIVMRAESNCVGVNIPAGTWHRIIALEPGTVIFEAKDGPFTPTSPDDILSE